MVTFDAKPSMCAAAAASPPPTTLTAPAAVAAAIASPTTCVPPRYAALLVDAHRSVEHDRLRGFDGPRVRARRRRADVEDHLVADGADGHDVRGGFGVERRGDDRVARQLERDVALLRDRRGCAARARGRRRASDVPTSTPCAASSVFAIPPPTQNASTSALSRSSSAELVFDLRAADRADERLGGIDRPAAPARRARLPSESPPRSEADARPPRSRRARGARSRRRR